MAIRLILDCDPGRDDAIAILMALAAPEIELLAITTVAGNVPLERATANARRIVELAGAPETPVFAGCPRPLIHPLTTAERVHGADGLNGVELPAPARSAERGHAVDAIIETLLARPAKSVVLAAIGPLTNIALAMRKEPAIVERIERITLMGGAIGRGNVTPAAEFNIYVDPHAADIVFRSGAPIWMLGLDVTRQALTRRAHLDRLRALGSEASRAAADILEFRAPLVRERDDAEGEPLHDPCVIGQLLRPELFSGRRRHVEIGLGASDRGRTRVDCRRGRADASLNATVIDRVEADGFFELALGLLEEL